MQADPASADTRARAAATTADPVTPPATTAAVPPPVETPAVTNAAATTTVDPQPAQEAPKPRFEEVTIKQGSVIGIRLDQAVSSETARVEDRVTAKVARDVIVDGRTALVAGTRLEGVVTLVERGGKMRDRARVGIKFTTMILADNLRVPIQTAPIIREGDAPGNEAGGKIGAGAVVGAIIGGVFGGKRGAVIGSTAGAAGGTAAVMAGGRNEALFDGGSLLTVQLSAPVTITIEKELSVR